jgi:hypothetical protein
MAKKEVLSIGPGYAPIKGGGQRNRSGIYSRPTPEEGRRLVHAFMDIKQIALREAVIQLVTDLSKLHDDARSVDGLD